MDETAAETGEAKLILFQGSDSLTLMARLLIGIQC